MIMNMIKKNILKYSLLTVVLGVGNILPFIILDSYPYSYITKTDEFYMIEYLLKYSLIVIDMIILSIAIIKYKE